MKTVVLRMVALGLPLAQIQTEWNLPQGAVVLIAEMKLSAARSRSCHAGSTCAGMTAVSGKMSHGAAQHGLSRQLGNADVLGAIDWEKRGFLL